MKNILKIFIFAALTIGAAIVYAPDVCAKDKSGSQVAADAAAFVRSSRKIEFKIGGRLGKNSYSHNGWLIANNKKCYLDISGFAKYDYEGSVLTMYNVKSDEYYIQKFNSNDEDPASNPFAIFINKHSGMFSSPVQAKTSNGELAVMVRMSLPGNKFCKYINIYVTGSGSNTVLKEIVIFSKKGEKVVTTITNYSAPDSSLLGRVSVTPRKGSKTIDLR
ncbi:MAG: hypothetical protein LKM37_05915 [Bacteroidales bacterium]|jgi:hypothetical protein|nr:hypothetical protein [Bacteroidales bacterium]MCI1734042.1 hypothetical protein [Bacteroidales bacterium]